jgi:hypothetical protein
MTLRLTDEQDRILTALAAREGVSKSEAVARAIVDRAERLIQAGEVDAFGREEAAHYADLLRRLGR